MKGFTFNKSLGGGFSAALLSLLLGFFHPFAGSVPLLSALVGLGTLVLTWLTPKNAAKSAGSPTSG